MLACGHDREPFGAPICAHLRVCRNPWLSYLRWYTGSGIDSELLCNSCAAERESGHSVTTELVCQGCFEYATTEIGDLGGFVGSRRFGLVPNLSISNFRSPFFEERSARSSMFLRSSGKHGRTGCYSLKMA
jgi:hypothetical protein